VQVWRHTHDAARGAAGLFLGQVPLTVFDKLDLWTACVVASRGDSAARSPSVA